MVQKNILFLHQSEALPVLLSLNYMYMYFKNVVIIVWLRRNLSFISESCQGDRQKNRYVCNL